MKKVVRAVSLMLLMAGVCGNAFAEENENIVRQGTIRGRVIDNGKQILPGASIFIENLKTGVISDVNGFYTLPNLKPGTYTVKVTYVGYSPIEMKVTVPEGKTLEKDIVMNEGVELQEVQVKGAFQGQKKAINTQKNNLGITNIVSADQVGKFPDSNIGDALKRISGINVQYDQGEARFGQVRGTSADLSSVTINGNRVPSAEGDTRNVQLDLIPADMIQTIEVSKVVTPDMDGDAIGGSINLVTKNSPYKRTINATAGSGYNWISEKAQLNLGFTYGDRFFNDRLGMLLSASYQNAPSGSYDTEFMWEQNEDGKVYVSDYQMRQYFVTRERQSYSAAFDFDINENHKLTFKGIFNNRNDWENRYRTNIKDLDENGKGTVRIQTKAGTPDNRNARLERQRTMDFALGGEHLWGAIGMDWNASYAKATEERPNERYLDFQLKKQDIDMDLSDERQPLATPTAGSTLTLSDKFSLKELTEQQEDIKEEDMKFSANFKTSLNNGAKLKFGAKVVRKTKEKEIRRAATRTSEINRFMLLPPSLLHVKRLQEASTVIRRINIHTNECIRNRLSDLRIPHITRNPDVICSTTYNIFHSIFRHIQDNRIIRFSSFLTFTLHLLNSYIPSFLWASFQKNIFISNSDKIKIPEILVKVKTKY